MKKIVLTVLVIVLTIQLVLLTILTFQGHKINWAGFAIICCLLSLYVICAVETVKCFRIIKPNNNL